ncbi:hypothetical protein CC79DRAFT_1358494 [Sarocladium strictum]|jgi:hypothetical protein
MHHLFFYPPKLSYTKVPIASRLLNFLEHRLLFFLFFFYFSFSFLSASKICSRSVHIARHELGHPERVLLELWRYFDPELITFPAWCCSLLSWLMAFALHS